MLCSAPRANSLVCCTSLRLPFSPPSPPSPPKTVTSDGKCHARTSNDVLLRVLVLSTLLWVRHQEEAMEATKHLSPKRDKDAMQGTLPATQTAPQ